MLSLLLAAATSVCFSHGPVMKSEVSPAAMQAVYPSAARIHGLEGQAKIACWIDARGAPSGCQILSEQPLDKGFGVAAVHLARRAVFYPAVGCGQPTNGRYTANIRFSLEERKAPAD